MVTVCILRANDEDPKLGPIISECAVYCYYRLVTRLIWGIESWELHLLKNSLSLDVLAESYPTLIDKLMNALLRANFSLTQLIGQQGAFKPLNRYHSAPKFITHLEINLVRSIFYHPSPSCAKVQLWNRTVKVYNSSQVVKVHGGGGKKTGYSQPVGDDFYRWRVCVSREFKPVQG